MRQTERISLLRVAEKVASGARGDFGEAQLKALDQLSKAVWGGRFDDQLEFENSPGASITRDILFRLFPKHEPWAPDKLRTSTSEASSTELLAELADFPLRDCSTSWRNTFAQLTIPVSVSVHWRRTKRSNQEEAERRIQRVMVAAAKLKKRYPGLSDLELARRLNPRDQGFEDYSTVTIRKIIGGTYRPALNYEIRGGLKAWMGRSE